MGDSTLKVVNTLGSINFDSISNYECIAKTQILTSNNFFTITSINDIDLETYSGNLGIYADTGIITINSDGNYSNAVIIDASNANGGILQTAGTGGINLITTNGDIDLLSQGSNINIGVSSVGTPAQLQTQNLNLESFNNFNVNSGDMYFISDDVISFVSNTGDIQFGTTSGGAPIIKFENGNVLINQTTSYLDYQVDIAVTHPSDVKDGYNGLVVNSTASNVAADITLQTSNTIGDGTQCILSMGSFGLDNKKAIFQTYLAYQTNNTIIRLDSPSYSPNSIDTSFGYDFIYSDIGRKIYWPTTGREDVITGLGSMITSSSDTANVQVSGTYTGNTSRIYLLQIDSLSNPNTFKWSNDGGVSFQQIFIPIKDTSTPIPLESNISVVYSATSGFSYNQQFTFQTKITAVVSNNTSILIPETLYTLQPFYSYIETITPSDIVIRTNNNEKMRITGDGSIGIQKKIPTASLDLNTNYNKVLLVNQSIDGYQLNPSISYLESGGYVIVWNSQDAIGPTLDFNVIGQRYLSDGSRYGSNFTINNITASNQSFPSISGNKLKNSNHFIVVWATNNTGKYKIVCQIYHNSNPIYPNIDIPISNTIPISSTYQLYPRVAGLYNGNYIIVWSFDDITSGVNRVYGVIIDDDGVIIKNQFQISQTSLTLSRNYPYVAALSATDPYYPNGFVVTYMTAIDSNLDPRYTIALRVYNYDATVSSAEIPITSVGSLAYSSISDGLVSVAEIDNTTIINNTSQILTQGSFILSFYRSYQADATLYNIGDNVSGNISGSTATISAVYPSERIITLQNVSNRFLVSEEINITSSVIGVGNTIEKVAIINFLSSNTANITLDVGNKDVMAYCFASNIAQVSDAKWTLQVNTSMLYNDLDRFTGNSSIYVYKRPMASISVDNLGNALITWSNGSIPTIYYQLINTTSGQFIGTEQRLTSQYDGLKQRDQVATHLQSIQGNDYGFVISWDNQSLDLQNTGIYQQLVGYNHSLFALEDGNSNLLFNHQNQLAIGTNEPESTLHIKSQLANAYEDDSPCALTIQNTSTHIITKNGLQSINFEDGNNTILSRIQSVNSLRYDDLYPQPVNLIGFYKFDETEGTRVIDSSGASTNLNIANNPVYINTNGILLNFDLERCWVDGIINNALLFNGQNNYVFVQNTSRNGLNTVLETGSQKLSLSAWVKIPNIINNGATYDIVSNGGDLGVAGTYLLSVKDVANNGNMVMTSNIIVNGITNIGIQGTTKLNDSNWHYITMTADLSSVSNCIMNIYVDGSLENTITQAGIINTTQHTIYNTNIGSRNGSINFFRGYLDELRFYNSILSPSDIRQLYNYGNPNLPAKGSLVLSPNSNATYNQGIVIDDNGLINNLSSRPLPYSIISGEIVAFSSNTTIYGINTNFLNELTIGDIIGLGTSQYTIITIVNNNIATLDIRAYTGPEVSLAYQSVMRFPSIYSFFDNSDSIRGHIDNFGNMMIGPSKPATMLEISGLSGNSNIVPEITISNLSQENTLNGRKTAVNFRSYDALPGNALLPPATLGRIETSHNNTSADNQGIMKFSVNNGTVMNTLMSLTSNGNIGLGGGLAGQNTPLTLVHATTQDTTKECEFMLQSKYYKDMVNGYSVFSERSDVYFSGVDSITQTIETDIKYRVLSGISGSNDSTTKTLTGRLDFLTNNDSNPTKNGIVSRMSITYQGNVGVSILQPANNFNVAPELTVLNGDLITIVSTASGGTVINLSENVFGGLDTTQRLMFVGGLVVVENASLTRAKIVSVLGNSQIQVDTNLSAAANIGSVIHIHYAGLNIERETGFTGVNTTAPTSVLSVNGSLSLPIISTSAATITLNLTNYTIICNTSANAITVSLPVNSSAIAGRIYVIKRTSVNFTCTIDTVDTALIDGSATQTVTNFAQVQSDGTNWWRISFG